MSEFALIKVNSVFVRQQLRLWYDFIQQHLRTEFDNNLELVKGTRFGDNIAKVAYITEMVLTSDKAFRGVCNPQQHLQAAALIEIETDCLEIDAIATAPWNVVENQPQSVKGAGTSLMEELVRESIERGYGGRLRVCSIPRATSFYSRIGFTAQDLGEMELNAESASLFLKWRKQEFDGL